MTNFQQAAHDYFDRGWVAIPLILDADGFPKKPFSNGWQHTPHEWDAIASLPWSQAKGLGLVLGAASDNLAAIDIDCIPLAAEILRVLQAQPGAQYYYVQTGRKRCHIYFREGSPSSSRAIHNLHWRGEEFGAELKAQGTQVAAPPTPGYTFMGTSQQPTPVPNVESAWLPIIATMGITGATESRSGSAGYPSPWRETLKEGARNNAVYVESCRLADARMPLDAAIATMLARVHVAYEGRVDERGIVATVRSAYRRVLNPIAGRGGVAL